MLSPKLETERLVLRRYKETDIHALYEIITDERLTTYIKFPKLTYEEELEYIKDTIKKANESKYEKGLHKYDSRDKLMDNVIYKFKESRKDEIKGDEPIYIYEYNKPKYNINCNEMYEYIINTQKKLNKYTR